MLVNDAIRRKCTAEEISSLAEATLGKFAEFNAAAVTHNGWEAVVRRAHGKSNILEGVRHLPHKAARLLEHLRGRVVGFRTSIAPWGAHRCDDAVQRGAHKSAR
jgi:hypothetical protein